VVVTEKSLQGFHTGTLVYRISISIIRRQNALTLCKVRIKINVLDVWNQQHNPRRPVCQPASDLRERRDADAAKTMSSGVVT
jgi:hypothetical protein